MEEQISTREFPYDDGDMIYDVRAHRYVLTKEDVRMNLGENLDEVLNSAGDANPSTLADRFLRRVSQIVYNYLYKDSINEQWIEYILAKLPSLRAWVKEMLESQVLYMLSNGDIGLYSGVNVAKGQTMDVNALRGRIRVAPEVEDIAMRTIDGFGYCLKYAGRLPCVPCNCYRRGY